jgi:hypothetical protein
MPLTEPTFMGGIVSFLAINIYPFQLKIHSVGASINEAFEIHNSRLDAAIA